MPWKLWGVTASFFNILNWNKKDLEYGNICCSSPWLCVLNYCTWHYVTGQWLERHYHCLLDTQALESDIRCLIHRHAARRKLSSNPRVATKTLTSPLVRSTWNWKLGLKHNWRTKKQKKRGRRRRPLRAPSQTCAMAWHADADCPFDRQGYVVCAHALL